jgi:lipid-binding SYLF domain-containing protein
MTRARRLAGYFASRAVEMQKDLGAKAQNDWGTAEWTKQGAMYAYSQAAVRFANGSVPGDNHYHEERLTRLLVDGGTNPETIFGETFNEGAW